MLVLVWKAVYYGLVLRHRFNEIRPYALLGRYLFFFLLWLRWPLGTYVPDALPSAVTAVMR